MYKLDYILEFMAKKWQIELFIKIPIFIRSCNPILQKLFMDRVTVLWWIESGLTSLKIINDLHGIKMFAVISNMFGMYLKILDRTIVPLSHQGHSSIFCNHISLVGSRQFSVKIYIYV